MRITFTGGTLVAGIAALTMTVISARPANSEPKDDPIAGITQYEHEGSSDACVFTRVASAARGSRAGYFRFAVRTKAGLAVLLTLDGTIGEIRVPPPQNLVVKWQSHAGWGLNLSMCLL